jgi:hypothetical protein
MKKLLLSLASLALISTSLYAGCTADVDMGGNRITDLGAPTAGTDAVNKDYVDNFVKIDTYSIVYNTGTSNSAGNSSTIKKVGYQCFIKASFVHNTDIPAGSWLTIASAIPSKYRPYETTRMVGYAGIGTGAVTLPIASMTTTGSLSIKTPLEIPANSYIDIFGSVICPSL